MSTVSKMLGQIQPTDTNPNALYAPESGKSGIIKRLFICNTTANTPTFRIFHEYAGTGTSVSTALYYDVSLSANEVKNLDVYIPVSRGSQVNVRCSAGNEVTFTAYGTETTRN